VRTSIRSVLQPRSHPEVVSVREFFRNLLGAEPGQKALGSLRALFPCTGQVTREQSRSISAQWEAFEGHRSEVLAALENSAVLREAQRILFANARTLGPDASSSFRMPFR
jgi:hypothetical protein